MLVFPSPAKAPSALLVWDSRVQCDVINGQTGWVGGENEGRIYKLAMNSAEEERSGSVASNTYLLYSVLRTPSLEKDSYVLSTYRSGFCGK